MRLPIPFTGPTAQARSSNDNVQLTENLYPEIDHIGKNVLKLYRTPGLKALFQAGNGGIRSNGVVFKGDAYFVSQNKLLKISTAYDVTEVGTLNTTGGRVSIAFGRTYIAIVDGVNGYTWDGATFAQITDVDFPNGATHITYLDGFFIANLAGSDAFYTSSSEDPTSWDALDFASAEKYPDDLVTIFATEDLLWMIGEYSAEAWYNSGGQDFPFSRVQAGVNNWGILAPYSIAQGTDTLFWLAKNDEGENVVVQAMGSSVQVISPPWLIYQISQLSETSDAIAFFYQQAGHPFYVLTFPTAKKTWVYDVSTQLWHTRSSWNKGRWRPSGYVFFNNKHIVGDFEGNQFYELDLDTYTDGSDPIKWTRRTTPVHKNYQELTFWELTVDIEGGRGLLSGQGSDPQVMLRYSDDGGHQWSDELLASTGQRGEYRVKARWEQLGASYERVFELSGTDPVPITILGAYARIEVAEH